jgi:hypothetical protein
MQRVGSLKFVSNGREVSLRRHTWSWNSIPGIEVLEQQYFIWLLVV